MSSFNLEISDYCEECGNFDADVDVIDITTMGGNEAYMTNIRCKNHSTCERLYQRLKDREMSK